MIYTSTIDIDLVCDDYESFYELISSTPILESSALFKYPDLMHVMPVCTASYMMVGYGHARHIF